MRKQPKRQVSFPRWENVRTIVLLFESDFIENNPVVRRMAERLVKTETDKNVILLGYADKICGIKEASGNVEQIKRLISLASITNHK